MRIENSEIVESVLGCNVLVSSGGVRRGGCSGRHARGGGAARSRRAAVRGAPRHPHVLTHQAQLHRLQC